MNNRHLLYAKPWIAESFFSTTVHEDGLNFQTKRCRQIVEAKNIGQTEDKKKIEIKNLMYQIPQK